MSTLVFTIKALVDARLAGHNLNQLFLWIPEVSTQPDPSFVTLHREIVTYLETTGVKGVHHIIADNILGYVQHAATQGRLVWRAPGNLNAATILQILVYNGYKAPANPGLSFDDIEGVAQAIRRANDDKLIVLL